MSAGTFVVRGFHSAQKFFIVVLVGLVVVDRYNFEILKEVLCHSYWYLYRASLKLALWVVRNPIIDRVFHVTHPVNIAKNFEVLYVFGVVEFLDLFVTVVLQEINHVFIHIHYLRVLPRGSGQIDEAIQIVNAKSDVDSIFGS